MPHPLFHKLKIHFTPKNVLILERIFGLFGLSLVVWMVYRLGPSRVSENLHYINWGFFILAGMKGLEYLFETLAWKLIMANTGSGIGFWKAFRVILEANALNYITVTRMGGEALKIMAFRERLGLGKSAASVIILKFCILLGFWVTICGGFIAILLNSNLESSLKIKTGMGIVLITLFLASFSWIQRIGIFKPLSWLLKKLEQPRGWIWDGVKNVTKLDAHVFDTYRSNPLFITTSVFLCLLVWVEEAVFIWLGLKFLNIDQGWDTVTIITTLSLLLNHLLYFVPWRAGTQEGTMVFAFTILDISEAAGLSIAILKRLRELIWVFAGLALFSAESLTSAESGNIPGAKK